MNHTDSTAYRLDDELAHVTGCSRQGTGREENQDAFAIDDHVWIVADGMGGHEGGRIAGAVAVATALESVIRGETDLEQVVLRCHDTVLDVGMLTDQPDMGSTIVVATRDDETGMVSVAWCGDSRAYVLRDGELARLTSDHNRAAQDVAAGRVTEHQAFDHPGQTLLTSALGCGNFASPQIGLVQTVGRGTLLLCTDGLTSGLRDAEIAEHLAGSATEGAMRLAAAAVAAGSSDDVTVVVVDLDASPEPSAGAPEAQSDSLDHVEEAVLALGGTIASHADGAVRFYLGDLAGHAYDKGGRILRLSVFLDDEVPAEEALAWVRRQPDPRIGSLEVALDQADGMGSPRLVVERLLPVDEEDAALIAGEASLLTTAWDIRRDLVVEDLSPRKSRVAPTVLSASPRNAWILYGSRKSLQTEEQLRHAHADWRRGLHPLMWTAPKHAEPGDLVFVYVQAPVKEIRYVARVANHPFRSVDVPVNAERSVAKQQWWAWLTPLHEIEPITLDDLDALAGERVVQRAHGGTYLRP